MKKHIILIALLCIIANTSIYAQTNYLNDAKYISEVIKKIEIIKKNDTNINDTTLKLKIDNYRGKKQLVSENDKAFNALFKKLLSQTESKQNPGSQPVAHNTPKLNPGTPPTGVGNQPSPSANRITPPKNNTQHTDDTVTIKESSIETQLKEEEAKKELRYILYIMNHDDVDQTIIVDAPKKFGAFAEQQEIDKNIDGTSGDNSTNFAFPETQIIYGIVDFTISRAKEQLVEKYLSGWYEKLDSSQIIKDLLPQTLGTLKAFNEKQSLSMARFGDKWKSAFQEDFRNVPLALQKESFVSSLLKKAEVSDSLQVAPIISGGSKLVYDLYLKKHLVNSVSDLSTDYLLEQNTINTKSYFKQAIVLTDILLKAGGEMKNNYTYKPVMVEGFKQMDTDAWKAFIKLLYTKHQKELAFALGNDSNNIITKLLDNKNAEVDDFANLFKKTISLISTYQTMINGGENQINSKLSFEDSRKLFELSFQLTEHSVDILSYLIKNNKDDTEKLIKFKRVSKEYYTAISEIAEGVANKQYGDVVDGTLGIMRLIDTQGKITDVITKLHIYGSFMINIINAKTADEVKTALEELIPKNLYQLKNTHSFSISLSAYPSVFGGWEKITKTNTEAASISAFMPMGIDFSIGNKKKGSTKSFSSTNLFLQFLDFGAVLNYRLNSKEDEEASPNVTFKQLLSPGFSIMRHFKNSPLVIGAGINYTPSLRTVNVAGNEYKDNAWRIGVFCAVDVTFFHLYNSKKILK